MGKLLEENSMLIEKLAESDSLRRRFMEKNQASEKEIKSVYMISMFQDSGVEEWNGEANGSAEEATKRFVRHEIHQP